MELSHIGYEYLIRVYKRQVVPLNLDNGLMAGQAPADGNKPCPMTIRVFYHNKEKSFTTKVYTKGYKSQQQQDDGVGE